MKVDEGQRSMAVSFMGATEIGEASFDKAIAYLQRAIAIEPKRVVHHLDLGRVYATKGDAAKAKAEFNTALKLPSVDYNDGHYKDDAKKALADLAKQ
jgi:Flp pilus assembly protein TadD